MQAIRVQQHGGLDALVAEEIAIPETAAGTVVVQVKACGVNHLDMWVRKGVPGHHFPLPLTLGSDIAGVVAETGPGVTGLELGTDVVVAPGVGCNHCAACAAGWDNQCGRYEIIGESRDGGYAEFIAVPRRLILPKPSHLSFVEAAAIGIPFLTAWHMLKARAKVQPGETVLVQAGASGVGTAAIQIAKLLGAQVIATAGHESKLAMTRHLGADHAISYETEDLGLHIKELTNGKGVDVVVEHVGQATWSESVRALAWHGRLVTCGATTGGRVQLNLHQLFFKSLSVLGSTMGSRGEFHDVLGLAAQNRLKPVIDRTLPLAQARDAHQALEERSVVGKIVLQP